jgi:predicted alpha-1,2-mannosidase
MKNFLIASAVILLASCTSDKFSEKLPVDCVNAFIGTGGHGHTFPGATVPFGMVQCSPDTRLDGWDGCSGYHYSDSMVYGFSHTHLSGTGVSDYGDILLMPCTGPVQFSNGFETGVDSGYASRFRKTSEKASPGYYAVHLDDADIDVELTATARAAIHRYRLPANGMHVIVDLDHRDMLTGWGLSQNGDHEISGFRISQAWAREQHVYFVTQFSRPIKKVDFFRESDTQTEPSKAAVHFDATDELLVRVGISSVSIDNARANLLAEIPDFDFDKVHKAARDLWSKQLNKIKVAGGPPEAREIFYTALYHTMVAPNIVSDADGRYRGMDMQVHQADHPVYTVFSLWDTFRALHPLFTIIEQERTTDFLRTFLLQHIQGGRLPVWELAANETDCMIGYHSVSVAADAFAKGITGFDQKLMLEAMKHTSSLNHFGLESYRGHGYIRASDDHESVSKTLEYAYDDWCIATYAKALGDTATHRIYMERAQHYKNLFDPMSKFFRARMDGAWFGRFDPSEVNFNFTEANAWQYSTFVPQDINGLMALHGGSDSLEAHLDRLFAVSSKTTGREQADITGLIGQYAHGNEPSHHMAYLYNYTGSPRKTQQRVRQIMDELYTNAPDGLSGNEDCGQMSAWYVMSAMGFYQVTPGLPVYAIGSPIFDKVEIALENGKVFTINATNQRGTNSYIQSVQLNGKALDRSYITHKEMMEGGTLQCIMGSLPNSDWGAAESQRPVSAITAPAIAMVPFYESEGPTFTDQTTIGIGSANPEAIYYYSLDGGDYEVYEGPIVLTTNTSIDAFAVLPDGTRSKTNSGSWMKIDGNRKIAIGMNYDNQYAAGGNNALIDRLRGSANFLTGRWQGYQDQPFIAVVDMGELQKVQAIGVGFLQDVKSWIWFPEKVKIETSTDAENWKLAGEVVNTIPDNQYGTLIQDYTVKLSSKVRYIRITAPNYGPCPPWHMGAGGKTWLFADEIWVE